MEAHPNSDEPAYDPHANGTVGTSRCTEFGELNKTSKNILSVLFLAAFIGSALYLFIFGGTGGSHASTDTDTDETVDEKPDDKLTSGKSLYKPADSLMSVWFGSGTADYGDDIIEAIDFWNEIVNETSTAVTINHGVNSIDLSKGELNTNELTVNGLEVIAYVSSFKGVAGFEGVLGYASPVVLELLEEAPGVKVRLAIMMFDLDAFKEMSKASRIQVMKHELGHALGLGSLWAGLQLTNPETHTYNGAGGVAGYQMLGSTSSTVPIQPGSQPGSSGNHWSEIEFEAELMSPVLDPGTNPLSVMSVKALEDLGYSVDISKAEPYSSPWFPNSNSALRGAVPDKKGPKIDMSRDMNVDIRTAIKVIVGGR